MVRYLFLPLDKSLSPQSCLGFVDDTTALLHHHALLIARYHIFWAKSMHHLPSLDLFIWNFLTCLEVERRFSFKDGFLAKFNKKWGAFLAEQENLLSFCLEQICFAYLCLLTHADVKRTANVEPYSIFTETEFPSRLQTKMNRKNYTNKHIIKLTFVTTEMFRKT